MSDPSVEDAIKQIVLANADGEIKSIAVVIINHDGEPEMQIAMAPNTAYSIMAGLDILKLSILNNILTNGKLKPKERE
jgi:hypothetical protein